MPFYYRNADGDELMFVHRGEGTIETDFGPLAIRDRAITSCCPAPSRTASCPRRTDNFFLIIQSKHRVRPAGKGLIGQHALYDPGVIVTPEPAPNLDDDREWEVRIKVRRRDLEGVLSVQPDRRGRLEGRSDGVEDQHARHPARS